MSYSEIHTKTCPWCKKEFQTNRWTAIFCSYKCRYLNKHQKKRERAGACLWYEKTCIFCNKTIVTNHNDVLYCSPECKKDHKEQIRQERIKNTPVKVKEEKPVYTRVCKTCGIGFTTTLKKKIYCCRRCTGRRKRPKKIGEYILTCKYCGKEFNSVRPDKMYCNEICSRKAPLPEEQKQRHSKTMLEYNETPEGIENTRRRIQRATQYNSTGYLDDNVPIDEFCVDIPIDISDYSGMLEGYDIAADW